MTVDADIGRADQIPREPIHIVQIAPFIGRGSGVAGVASNLDREFRALGATVETFTYPDARQGKRDPRPKGWKTARLVQSWRVIWFSTVGTRRAIRFLAERPDAVAICHNNVMAGDVYVNHGILYAAMRARGNSIFRFLLNPTHIFTHLRDLLRYRSGIHRVVVVLTRGEAQTLRDTYGRVRPAIAVISNGVDLERFRRPTALERSEARAQLHLDDADRVAVFVGHEFARKGLPIAIAALAFAPTVLLLVIGGDARSIEVARSDAERAGVAERVLLLGSRTDPRPYLAAADFFVLPSMYESSGLVFLEALASGLPVVATPVGVAAEVVRDGVNGYLVDRDPAMIGDRLESLAAEELGPWRQRARDSVASYSWSATASQYLALAEQIRSERAKS